MKKFIWASVHAPTKEQIRELTDEGELLYLNDLDSDLAANLSNLTFDDDLRELANKLVDLADGQYAAIVQPAGSPAFQNILGQTIAFSDEELVAPVWYSSSERVSEDIPQPDGSVKKISVFKHDGWLVV